jgi:hypothetical protein
MEKLRLQNAFELEKLQLQIQLAKYQSSNTK